MTRVAVRNEQVRMLYSQSVPVLLANVVNSGIVSAALWGAGPRRLLLVWTGLVALMTVGPLAAGACVLFFVRSTRLSLLE